MLIVLGHSIADHIQNVVSFHIAVDTCVAGRDKLEQFQECTCDAGRDKLEQFATGYGFKLSFWRSHLSNV